MRQVSQQVSAIVVFSVASSSGQVFSGQVIFSRRIYKEQGASYQQIWTWNPATGDLKALTQSPRNHYLPDCVKGKITFVSPEKYEDNVKLWSFDPATGAERVIGPGPGPPSHSEEAPKNGCDRSAKAGALEACATGEDLALLRAGKQTGRLHMQENNCFDAHGGTHAPCETPIVSLAFSPDGGWLLVGELDNAHSNDYSVVDTVSLKVQKVASAFPNSTIWLQGNEGLLYVTPMETVPLSGTRRKRTVWVQQLMLFNPTRGTTRAITSGVTSNVDAALCRQ